VYLYLVVIVVMVVVCGMVVSIGVGVEGSYGTGRSMMVIDGVIAGDFW
jgi:hypothetical protein